jgi:hypothetical protein
MLRIKGFDKNLKCSEMQFEIGKEYKLDTTELKLCTNTVFHYCKTLKQANGYYPVQRASRYCYIEVLGEEIEDDDKCGSNHIKIVREILGEELDILLGRVSGNTGIFNNGKYNTGDRNTGDWNTGYGNAGGNNTGNSNTGYGNAGNYNAGDWNTGHYNTGDRNTGNFNTGDRNTGYGNAGDNNTGHYNTGDRNTGNFNTGDWNTGDRNTGDFNICNYSSGFFCTKEPKVRLFNQELDMTISEFKNSKYYVALLSSPFTLTEEIDGKLVKYTYEEACAEWWKKMSEEKKKIVKSIPNFDAEIFEEITGIKEEK